VSALSELSLDARARALLGGERSAPIVGIVGARRADDYGLQTASRLAQLAAEAGYLLLSGGAKGIDCAAHRGALSAGGASIAVLGCGLSRAPHRLSELRERGLGLASPHPNEAPAQGWRFAKRNEDIARCADLLIIVQALKTSGSLITARHALKLGRPVWVAPGPLGSPHEGCYLLLDEGAKLLSSHDAWLEGRDEHRCAAPRRFASPPTHNLSRLSPAPRPEPPPDSALYRVACAQPLSPAELAERAGLALPSVLAEATLLEMSGWLRAAPGGLFVRVESSIPSR